VRLRDAAPEDLNYIMGTWLHSYLSRYPGRARSAARRAFQPLVRDIFLTDPRTVVLASGPRGDTLHSWACGTRGRLHYVYTPRELRGEGLAKRCIEAVIAGYPERIECSFRWPWESRRFTFSRFERTAA
jgi:hypothetical protein